MTGGTRLVTWEVTAVVLPTDTVAAVREKLERGVQFSGTGAELSENPVRDVAEPVPEIPTIPD